MQVTGERSVTAEARRRQIVAAAIETIAELGYAKASFARIAERAGLSSTRLISYHFVNKKELIEQVVAEIFSEIGAFMQDRMADQDTPTAALHAYIRGNLEFMKTHRTSMMALLSIFLSGGLVIDGDEVAPHLVYIEQILQDGQKAGEFREFDAMVMASVIQRAIEGVPLSLARDPGLDLQAYADELIATFDLAIRRGAA